MRRRVKSSLADQHGRPSSKATGEAAHCAERGAPMALGHVEAEVLHDFERFIVRLHRHRVLRRREESGCAEHRLDH